MKTMNEWYPVSSVSEKVNIPPETVRRYVRVYEGYLSIKRGERNAYLIHESSLGTIQEIRYLLEKGNPHEQVKDILDAGKGSKNESKGEKMYVHMLTPPPDIQTKLLEQMQQLREQNHKLLETLNTMHERMNRLEELVQRDKDSDHEQVDEQDRLERDQERKRDEYLMNAMNEMQEKRKEVDERKGIFSKLFRNGV